MVTGKLIYDWKNQTVSSVVTHGQQIIENIKEDRTEKIEETYTEIHIDETVPNLNLREHREE